MVKTSKNLQIGIVIGSEPPIQTATECIEAAVKAEKDGFDSIWVPDHLCDIDGTIVDPWITLTYIAAKTDTARLYTGVTDFQKIHPAKLAQMVATLDELSNGRITLGIGSGEAMNIVPYGLAWDKVSVRVKKFEEYIKVIRLLWQSSIDAPVSFQGQYYSLHDAFIDQKVTQKPYPQVCIGAFGSRRMLDLIGRIGDGWFPAGTTSSVYKERLNTIYQIARESNRDPDSLEAASLIFVVVSTDSDVISKSISTLKAYIATTNRSLLRSEGVELPTTEKETDYQKMTLSRDILDDISKLAERVPPSVVKKVSAIGSIDEVIEFLEERINAGATHLVLNPSQGILKENWKNITEEIIPYLKDKYSTR